MWLPWIAGLHRQRVPVGFGEDVGGGLERLRRLSLCGDALHLRSCGDGDGGRRRIGGQTGGGRDGEGKVGRGGDAGRWLVADQLAELRQRVELGGGAQIALVGEPLLIEGEDVEHDRSGIEKGDAEIVVVARLQRGQRWILGAGETREHRFLERRPRAGSIGDRGEPRAIGLALRRLHADAGAAAAGAVR